MKNSIKKIKNDEKGIALIEFAIVLPVISLLLLGCVDLGFYLIAHQRISRAAYTTSNLFTQMDQGLKEAQVSDMLLAINQVSQPYDINTDGKAIITAIIGNGVDGSSPDSFSVAWQRCYGTGNGTTSYGGQGTTVSQSDFPENTIVTTSQILVVTELSYNFVPFFGILPLGGEIKYNSYFRPRRGTIENIVADGTAVSGC